MAEVSSRPGTGAAVTGPDVELDVVPTVGSGVQVLAAADRLRAFTASPPAAGLIAGSVRNITMSAKPRWLLAIPGAIGQVDQLERQLLTRRDIERLFGEVVNA